MSYQLIFGPDSAKFIEKLSKDLREKIFKKIYSTIDNPFHFFEQLERRTDFKLRVGDYRVIADINIALKRIEVTFVEHRKKVYKILNRDD